MSDQHRQSLFGTDGVGGTANEIAENLRRAVGSA